MRVVVPFAAERPKTRLSDVLSSDERKRFAAAMRRDVVRAVRTGGGDPVVLATAPVDDADAPVTVDDRPLTTAVNAVLTQADGAVGVVMADLALATGRAVARLLGASGDVAIAPGRGGGTNALAVRHSEFRVDYHGASYLDHLRAARKVGASVREVDSHRLATDVDEPDDLAELLLHADGAARDWLVDAGFELDVREGRTGVRRRE